MTKHIGVSLLGLALIGGLAAPLATGASTQGFYIDVMIGGLMGGVLTLVDSLGIALFFKAPGVFRFDQGEQLLFVPIEVSRLGSALAVVIGAASD